MKKQGSMETCSKNNIKGKEYLRFRLVGKVLAKLGFVIVDRVHDS